MLYTYALSCNLGPGTSCCAKVTKMAFICNSTRSVFTLRYAGYTAACQVCEKKPLSITETHSLRTRIIHLPNPDFCCLLPVLPFYF